MGHPTVFVRLTGCPLRCGYCDTSYAFSGGEIMSVPDILDQVASHGVKYVCVTGGEPLAQPDCLILLEELCSAGHEVSLETSGALDVASVDPRVTKVIDIKTPGSGEVERNRWDNLRFLNARDQIKFVICDRADYEWASRMLGEMQLDSLAQILFSPAFGHQPAVDLAEWILQDRLPVRMQLQLHKILWGEERGR